MKLLITGCNGFLGSSLVKYFSKINYDIIGTSLSKQTHHQFLHYISGDLSDKGFVNSLMSSFKPDIIINTVALVDLDLCEIQKNNSYKTNVQTAINLSDSLTQNIHLIHISSDHLFDGKKSFYTEEDDPQPLNVYATTKFLAERECMIRHPNTTIIRTNIIGWSPPDHKNTFAEWIYYNLKDNLAINMFIDYFFTPIEVNIFSEVLGHIFVSNLRGILNVAGIERCSKYEFGILLAKLLGFDTSLIIPTKMDSYNFKANRPKDLSLSTNKFSENFNYKLPNLKESLISFNKNRSGPFKLDSCLV